VKEVADLAIAKAKKTPRAPELRWVGFLGGEAAAKATKKKPVAKKNMKTATVKPKKKEKELAETVVAEAEK
jgi:hypothetical protein